jgi:hypothetical protein
MNDQYIRKIRLYLIAAARRKNIVLTDEQLKNGIEDIKNEGIIYKEEQDLYDRCKEYLIDL